jgi:hypothetical protein
VITTDLKPALTFSDEVHGTCGLVLLNYNVIGLDQVGAHSGHHHLCVVILNRLEVETTPNFGAFKFGKVLNQ